MATIKEIAALAGVSRGTVDRALNGRGAVNAETAANIRRIAQALNYKPNKAGLTLAAQKKNLKLGVILFSQENPFFSQVLEGVRQKAEELLLYNCAVTIRQVPFGAQEQLQAIDELLREGVNGIALAPYNNEKIREKINILAQNGIPVVTLNTDIEGSRRLAYVGSNYAQSGAAAAGLLSLMVSGPVCAGIITGSSHILCHTERIAGFTECLKERCGQSSVAAILENNDNEEESFRQTERLLSEHPEINALFFAAGGVCGGCRAVIAAGLAGKLPVLSFDNVASTRRLLEDGVISATICQQPQQQGSSPLALLFDYLTAGDMPEQEYHYTAVDIKIRETL